MMIASPKFEDITGYFPGRSIDTTFYELNEGLEILKAKLGDDTYVKLREMSDLMRTHFEADPENKTEDTLKGREIILNMVDIIKQAARVRRSKN